MLRTWRKQGSVARLSGSLLPRYLGLYTLNVGANCMRAVRVVVMLNILGGSQPIHRRFDLKGSTCGRAASDKELKKSWPVLKDLDFINTEKRLSMNETNRRRLLATLHADAQFLSKHGLMDYSLLVGIHDKDDTGDEKLEPYNMTILQDHARLCYIGMVDVLTRYSWRKGVETFMTSTLLGGREVSCQAPSYYAERFLSFLECHVFVASE